ncbi:unnamed protein product [Porites lobata]|uniref:DDE Tnp4 domain-containing protein n=1 Tax=Porites lobata TaxID=104759 RepID=A0ABN8R245_9CNID|nr:unnamed protein product [Porites lobata]
MSFEDARNVLLIAYVDGFLDDEEFIVLYDYYQPVNPSFPYWNFDPFCLDVFDSCECEAHFRVAKDDIPMLLKALRIPTVSKKQRVVYNGHKRVHALKFQSVVVPNGLIANLYGPVEGARHDAGMLKDSGLLQTLEREAYNPRGDVLCLYGDPAYSLRPHLMAPYRTGEVPVFTADMEAFNSAMSSARASVEWLFGDISNSFKFLDFKKNLKLGLSAVGKQYIVSALFRNILTCLYGNTTSTHFQLDPPTVQDYLA